MSPGAVALLVSYPQSAAAVSRLSEAVTDPHAGIRAAAARVIFVTRPAGLLPRVAAALDQETDADALFEQSRVLAHVGGPAYDARVLAAAERTGSFQIALAIAGARGPAALDLLPRIQSYATNGSLVTTFIQTASRLEPGGLSAVVTRAIQTNDDRLLTTVFQVFRDARVSTPIVTLTQAFDSPREEIRTTALWHLLRGWDDGALPTLPDAIQRRLTTLLDSTTPPAAPATILGYELGSRALGRPARRDTEWTAFLAKPQPELTPFLSLVVLGTMLTPDELSALATTYARSPQTVGRRPPFTPLPQLQPSTDPVMSTASNYPAGFMSAVFTATGCKTNQSDRQNVGGAAAEVTMRQDGRVSRINMLDNVSRQCQEAVRVLFMNYAADAESVVRENEQRFVLIPFQPDYIACQDVPRSGREAQPLSGNRIEPPRKIRDVKPRYPTAMQDQRISGLVLLQSTIASTGCIRSARVIRGVHRQLDWAAMRAVVGWGFTPTRLNGEPIDLSMSVTVNFTLT